MKFNKWTLGLAAVGAVSMASAVRADEAKLSQLNTLVSGTTISGVADVAVQYNTGDAHYNQITPSGTGSGKVDNFTVNDVLISLDKALDESPWAAGYHIDLNWGNDAIQPINSVATLQYYGGSYYYGAEYTINSGLPVRQAYVTLRTPVGNGIDWKVGLFDNIIGYESNTSALNPNYTHSYGYQLEPTSQAGVIGSYKIGNSITVQAGLANSYSAYYTYYGGNVSAKTYLAAVTLTAPESWGWAKGAALTVGANQAFNGNSGSLKNNYNYYYGSNYASYPESTGNYYAGLTLPTPIKALKVGFAFDLVGYANEAVSGSLKPNSKDDSVWVAGAYATFQATDKLSVSLRGEYLNGSALGYSVGSSPLALNKAEEVTATVQYNLWANVVSRVEVRWDHLEQGKAYGYSSGSGYYYSGNSYGARSDAFQIALNLAYQF